MEGSHQQLVDFLVKNEFQDTTIEAILKEQVNLTQLYPGIHSLILFTQKIITKGNDDLTSPLTKSFMKTYQC